MQSVEGVITLVQEGRVAGFVRDWSLPRQFAGEDPTREAAQSTMSRQLRPRLEEADTIGTSICPYCAVGCAQLVYAKDGHVIHVEGDPRSPINQGALCPKGADLWLADEPRPADQGALSRAARRELGRMPARLGDGPDRLSGQTHARRNLCT